MSAVADRMLRTAVLITAGALGIAIAANALFMLIAPNHWYSVIPGLGSTGPTNTYFIREIGLFELFVAHMWVVGLFRARLRLPCWAGATAWRLRA